MAIFSEVTSLRFLFSQPIRLEARIKDNSDLIKKLNVMNKRAATKTVLNCDSNGCEEKSIKLGNNQANFSILHISSLLKSISIKVYKEV